MKGKVTFVGTSATSGGDISDIWGGHQRQEQIVYNFFVRGTSATFGGDISDIWGGHQRHLGGTSATKVPLNAAEKLAFFAPKLTLNLF